MKILLDDEPCDVPAETVGEAIDAAAAVAEGRGRLLVDVTVDGSRWTETELASPACHAATADVVHFASAEPAALVRRTLAEASNALAEADELQREAAELLQSDQHTVSMDKLSDAVSIWLSVQEAIIKGSRLVGLDLDKVVIGDVPLVTAIAALNERLGVLRGALEDRDEIELADTLLYEFPKVVQEWQAVLAELRARLDTPPAGDA